VEPSSSRQRPILTKADIAAMIIVGALIAIMTIILVVLLF